MSDKVDYQRIQAIVESAIDMKVRLIIDEKIDEKLAPLQNNIDATLQIVKRVEDEVIIIGSKVDNHETRIAVLESNFASA
jgi:hypothetical protein